MVGKVAITEKPKQLYSASLGEFLGRQQTQGAFTASCGQAPTASLPGLVFVLLLGKRHL
jgi:hypothetical protein